MILSNKEYMPYQQTLSWAHISFLFTPECQLLVYSHDTLKLSLCQSKDTLSWGNNIRRESTWRDLGTLTPLATRQPGMIWNPAETYTSFSIVYKDDIAYCVPCCGSRAGARTASPWLVIPFVPITWATQINKCFSPLLYTSTIIKKIIYFGLF